MTAHTPKAPPTPGPVVEIIIAEDDSCQLQFYARGHHEREMFLQAVQAYLERENRDIRIPACAIVRQIHWRKVPVRDHYVVEHVMHESGTGRGAFAATLLDEWFPLHAYRARSALSAASSRGKEGGE